MAFTTWAALKSDMENDMASDNWRVKSYELREQSKTFRNWGEYIDFYKFVCHKAQVEAGNAAIRVHAKQGGRC
jgi:hypothetical protein